MKNDISCVINPKRNENGDLNDDRIDITKNHAMNVKNSIEITKLSDILKYTEIYWDNGEYYETNIKEDQGIMNIYKEFEELYGNASKSKSSSPWVLRLVFDKFKMLSCNLKMIDIYTKLNTTYDKYIECVYSDDNAEECVFRIKLTDMALKDGDEIATIKAIEHNIVHQILLKGYKGIKKVSLDKKKCYRYNDDTNNFDEMLEWVLDTDGTNLIELLSNPNIDTTRTISNDIREIYDTLGIEAARYALYKELLIVTNEGSMNYRHMSLLIDTMTYKGQLMSIDRHGINRGDIGPLAKSSFEETTDMLINASIFAEYDKVNGVSANVMLGQQPPCGTGDSKILIDEDYMIELLKDVRDTNKQLPSINEDIIDIIDDINNDEINDIDEDDLQVEFNLNKDISTTNSKCYKLPEQKIRYI